MACWSSSSSAGCISIRVIVTLSVMSGSLLLQSSRSMFGVLLMDSRSWIWIWIWIWVNVLLVYACSSL
jgi:hypothetical protein